MTYWRFYKNEWKEGTRNAGKIKLNFADQEYKRLYPNGSAPGKFYDTAKVHKILITEGVDKLPIRPIISNIGTPTYQLAKYLAKLLSPLANSKYCYKH